MTSKTDATCRPWLRSAQMLGGLTLILVLLVPSAPVKAQSAEDKPGAAKPAPPADIYQTIYLTNATQQNELNDIQTDLRNMLPRVRVYSVPPQNAISIHGAPEDIAQAQKIVSELDRPRKVYRLMFTIADSDGGKRIGAQHYTLIVASGEKTLLKEGSKVPIVTGSNDASNPGTQVQYQDVGLNIEATVNGNAEGVSLKVKVEQSGMAEEKSGVGPQDPVVRQSVLDSVSILTLGKPLVLGSLDVPGSTRHQDVEVVAELVR